MAQQNTSVEYYSSGPGCLVRGLYFLFIGWWFGLLWVIVAWFFNLTIIGLPLGLLMINRLPQVMTLRPQRIQKTVTIIDGAPVIHHAPLQQNPFLLRAAYFILVGFWLSLVWMLIAWLLTVLTFGLATPLTFWMFDQVPAITTLARIEISLY